MHSLNSIQVSGRVMIKLQGTARSFTRAPVPSLALTGYLIDPFCRR